MRVYNNNVWQHRTKNETAHIHIENVIAFPPFIVKGWTESKKKKKNKKYVNALNTVFHSDKIPRIFHLNMKNVWMSFVENVYSTTLKNP